MDNQPQSIDALFPKNFMPSEVEVDVYALWEKSGYLKPEAIADLHKNDEITKKPFVMTLPPPNANGSLHLGHVSGYTYQDLMGRFNRMKGHPTLLLPGKDHAGIQTEVVFEKILEKKGIKKRDLGREEFYRQCYEFCMESSATAREQEKSIGLGADFSREKFTLDPELTKVIFETFRLMFEAGLIYRGKRIINWCIRDQTSLADIDTEKVEELTHLWDIKYKIADSDEYIVVSTTRPETMFGDTAVAVAPNDERYKHLIGKKAVIPYINREIPIIEDYRIDKEFGTGAVKVTPAHSATDYAISKDHNLEIVTVIDRYGKMIPGLTATYGGLKIEACRTALVADLEKDGFLLGTKEHTHNIAVCERCKSKIEPSLQWQWFIDVSKIKQPAIDAIANKELRIYPKSQEKMYLRWLNKLDDWCISRQLWWGHQIPVWYCGSKEYFDSLQDGAAIDANQCGKAFFSVEKPEKCPHCGNTHVEQESDVLDTWFSSGHWPFSTLGGPEGKDYAMYYPTDVMETGIDILFFWVARMVMIGTYRTGKVPFSKVFLHGLVTDKEGKKMSKSRGNGVDPHEMIKKYGADAVRMTFLHSNSPGRNYRVYEEKIGGFGKFINKVWNGARFTVMQFEGLTSEQKKNICSIDPATIKTDRMTALNEYVANITRLLEHFKFGLAAVQMYEFWWHTFCDKYIEEIKTELKDAPEDKKQLLLAELWYLLKTQIKVMHPFIPFVTEEIWRKLHQLELTQGEQDLLMIADWPSK